jgi:tripartite ATP-independent transporter DctM subunit
MKLLNWTKAIDKYRKIEGLLAFIILVLMALIPLLDLLIRKIFQNGIESANNYTVHLVLLITFVGGMITTRENQHISVAAFTHFMKEPWLSRVKTITIMIGSALTMAFSWSALALVVNGFGAEMKVGFIPVQWVAAIMPIGYGLMAIRLITSAKLEKTYKWVASIGLLIGTVLAIPSILDLITALFGQLPPVLENLQVNWAHYAGGFVVPGIIILVASALFGTPLYTVLGGVAYLLFTKSGGSLAVIPSEAYTLLISSSIPTIPLFTLVGFVLAQSKAGERLIRVFKALFGWLPGGMVIAAVIVSAFFTTFTGASGVTILALGGVLFYVLSKSGQYKESFSIGLLTACGSIGLFFPPSLPIILYGSMARISIFDLFVGGLLPGILMVAVMAISGIFSSMKNHLKPIPFSLRETLSSLKGAFWELLLPVIIVGFYFTGTTSLLETAAIAVIYIILVEVFINKDIKIRNLPEVAQKAVLIIGGVLVIISLARGLSYFIVDAQLPTQLSAWVGEHIHSKIVFLLILNLALILVGMFMDIYSAILVVVPLIIPLGQLFGINPVHLGIIFIANMEHGFITPPIGLNLFLSSYCFNQPYLKVCRDVALFFFIQLVILGIITYVPWLSTVLLNYIKLG